MSDDRRQVSAVLNGEPIEALVDVRQLLVGFLREERGLMATKIACEDGTCGACTVLFDGEPVRSCLLFATQATDHAVQTLEGLDGRREFVRLQEAFRTHHALQCGFCAAGVLLTALALVSAERAPSEREVREALSGVVCRCTGYHNIVEAVLAATTEDGDEQHDAS